MMKSQLFHLTMVQKFACAAQYLEVTALIPYDDCDNEVTSLTSTQDFLSHSSMRLLIMVSRFSPLTTNERIHSKIIITRLSRIPIKYLHQLSQRQENNTRKQSELNLI